ncbi:hypothetical protein P7C73_g3175, partial [Tremellales sp. Uapishka_1]
MTSPTTPYQAPIRRRTPASPYEDISTLTLPEIRSRLERNSRVLNTGIFSMSPPSTSPIASGSTIDPIREKLLSARKQLQEREQELLASQSGNVGLGENEGVREGGGNGRSGKARALEVIQQGEAGIGKNNLILGVAQSMALGERDYNNQTISSLSSMSIHQPQFASKDKSKPPPQLQPDDENAQAQRLARMNAFMSHRDDEGDDDMFEEDEHTRSGEDYRHYDASEIPVDVGKDDTLGEIDEDDADLNGEGRLEIWAEGNEDYEQGAGSGMDAGPV